MIILIILLVYTWLGIFICSASLGEKGDWINGINLFAFIFLWAPIIIIGIMAKIFKKYP